MLVTNLHDKTKYDIHIRIFKQALTHGLIKPVTTAKNRNYLISRPNYHTTKFFTEKLLAIEMRKSPIFINKYFFRFINIILE